MKRSIALLTMTSILLTSGLAAKGEDARMRQLSEVVFQNYPAGALARGEQGAVYFVVTLAMFSADAIASMSAVYVF